MKNLNIPLWVAEILKDCRKTGAPYIYKPMSELAFNYLGDLVNWCQKNGANETVLIHEAGKRFIKIVDPLAWELENKGLLEK